MNKQLSLDTLKRNAEPKPEEVRSMLIRAGEDFDAKVKPETNPELVDRMVSEGKISLTPADTDAPPEGEFDWLTDKSVIVPEQQAIAVYRNPQGDLVIRQERSWCQEDDSWIVIHDRNVETFIDKLCDVIGILSAGK